MGATIFIDGDEADDAIETTYNALVDSQMIQHSVDTIPYTEDFERLYLRVCKVYPMTRNEMFCKLMNRRKQGRVPAPDGRRRKAGNNLQKELL